MGTGGLILINFCLEEEEALRAARRAVSRDPRNSVVEVSYWINPKDFLSSSVGHWRAKLWVAHPEKTMNFHVPEPVPTGKGYLVHASIGRSIPPPVRRAGV